MSRIDFFFHKWNWAVRSRWDHRVAPCRVPVAAESRKNRASSQEFATISTTSSARLPAPCPLYKPEPPSERRKAQHHTRTRKKDAEEERRSPAPVSICREPGVIRRWPGARPVLGHAGACASCLIPSLYLLPSYFLSSVYGWLCSAVWLCNVLRWN